MQIEIKDRQLFLAKVLARMDSILETQAEEDERFIARWRSSRWNKSVAFLMGQQISKLTPSRDGSHNNFPSLYGYSDLIRLYQLRRILELDGVGKILFEKRDLSAMGI